ncbi:GAF domain-containing protein, partial [bacterium]|nr:GAF domain-containing protein [bacterium]
MNDQTRLSLRESLFRKTLKNIISEKNTKKLSQLILKHGIELLNMDSGGIFLLKKEEVGKLSYSAAMNIPVPFVGRMFSKKDSLISHIISTGKTVVLKDISAGSQLGKVWRGLGYKIVIGSPIIYQGKVLGVIQLASTDPKIKVDSFEKETLEIYAEYTSIAIHNAQLFGQLQEKTIDLEGTRDVLEEIGSYLDNIIKNIVDVLIVIDPDGKIKTVNKAASELL